MLITFILKLFVMYVSPIYGIYGNTSSTSYQQRQFVPHKDSMHILNNWNFKNNYLVSIVYKKKESNKIHLLVYNK